MLIAVVNQSTLVSNDEAAQMTSAVATQLHGDFAWAWERQAPALSYYTDPALVPADAHGVAIVDTIANEPAGVLGYHTENPDGSQWGIVAARPELDNGGQVLTGDWSVSSVLSHEVLELAADPSCTFWGAGARQRTYAVEVCDPVEAPTYQVEGVSVSNFITPQWFDPYAPLSATFDHLGLLKAPFTLLPHGYVIYAWQGREHQKFGDEFPAWRKVTKTGKLARTRRRLAQAAGVGWV